MRDRHSLLLGIRPGDCRGSYATWVDDSGKSPHIEPTDMSSGLPEQLQTELVSAARTTVGDELRSVTYFTEETVDQLYLRDDLDRTADLIGFAENERLGFRSKMAYRKTQLGDYLATIRMFEHGYLTRVIVGDRGVWVTTDPMQIDRFEELAKTLATVLQES